MTKRGLLFLTSSQVFESLSERNPPRTSEAGLSPRDRVRRSVGSSGWSHCSSMSRGASWGDHLLGILGVSLWSLFWGPEGSLGRLGLSFLAKDTKLVTRTGINGRKRVMSKWRRRNLRADAGIHTGSVDGSFTQPYDHHTPRNVLKRTRERLNWNVAKVSCLHTSVWIRQFFRQNVNWTLFYSECFNLWLSGRQRLCWVHQAVLLLLTLHSGLQGGRVKAGHTLDKSPVHHWATHTHTLTPLWTIKSRVISLIWWAGCCNAMIKIKMHLHA